MIQTIALHPATGAAPGSGGTRCQGCREGATPLFPFSFAYQPIVDLATRSIWAHEALVRGPQGEGALTVLEQVTADNRYRFDQDCRVTAISTASRLGMDTRLSINFLPQAVYRPEICIRTTLEAAGKYNIPLDRIVFEVTEGERVTDGPWLAAILTEYQRCGFLTAIDDFGAGFAGLTLLADFQPDIVKLDMSLVRNVDSSRPRQAIARGILRMCEELAITVIAEGIETAGERDFFTHEGVNLMQGYLFARPRFEGVARAQDIFGN